MRYKIALWWIKRQYRKHPGHAIFLEPFLFGWYESGLATLRRIGPAVTVGGRRERFLMFKDSHVYQRIF